MTLERILLGMIGSLLIGGGALAQVEQAIISGIVTDPSGAAIPGAQITIVHRETNTAHTAETDVRGFYRSIPLRVGTYAVAAEKIGFKRSVRSGINLSVQQQAEVDLRLEVGALAEEVTVRADAPLLQTAEASRGEVIDNQKIVDLPLNGRDYLQLALLTAGTNVPPPGSRFGGFSSGGMRVTHNNYLLDGMDNNSNQQAAQGRTAQVITPSIDAIQQFKVQTTNYSAEFGRNLAGVVNVVLKSGSNEFHGGAFNFLRNEKLDAKNFFDRLDDPIPPYKRNQFGGLLGGPIRKDRTFFFANYEGTRIRTSDTVLSTVPTQREREGVFSESVFNRQPARIFDPLSYNAQTRTRQEFPNAVVPASRLDPVGFKVAALYPVANRPGVINNFLFNPFEVENADKVDVRIDHNLGPNDSIYGRVNLHEYRRTGEGNLPAPAFGGGDGSTTQENLARSVLLSHSHIFSPSLFNALKLGYNRLLTKRSAPVKENLSAQIGLRGLPIAYPGLSTFGVSGFATIGTQSNNPHDADSQTRQITDDLTWVHGRHTVKTGINLSFIQAPLYTAGRGTGAFTFNGNFTRQSSDNQFGHPLADLLVGIPFNTQIASPTLANQRRRLYQGYVHDEFKATARLVFNLGVRYEYVGPWFEKYNRFANFDIDSDPGKPALLFARPGGTRERSTVNTDLNNLAPRAGIAYRLSQRTVLRTGYGIYYGGVDNYGGAYLGNNPPFTVESTLSTDSIRPTIVLRDGLPPGATTSNITNLRTISQDRRNLTPYSQQWSMTLQRELAANLSF